MNINSLNQCFFLGHQSYLRLLSPALRCEMTDFCLAVLQEETTQLRFKGTIFRGGGGGGYGEGEGGERGGREREIKRYNGVWGRENCK